MALPPQGVFTICSVPNLEPNANSVKPTPLIISEYGRTNIPDNSKWHIKRAFVEIYNPSAKEVSLNGWSLSVKEKLGGQPADETLAGKTISPYGVFVICEKYLCAGEW